MAVRVDKGAAVEIWQDFMLGVYPGCMFHHHWRTFASAQPREMPPRLGEILAELGEHGHAAVFAVHENAIVGFWADTHHNYMAIRFSKASGDDFDGFTVLSIG